MFYVALATDYDDTIATDGAVDPLTTAALHAVKRSGRRLLLVTGRELPELLSVFPEVDLFDLVVAENGALLYDPGTHDEIALAPPPDARLVQQLQAAGIAPLTVGRSIVATRQPHDATVLACIREGGLEAQIIFNKGAVMVLPPGVNKASGLAAALDHLSLASRQVVGIGDAENDHAFLQACGFRAAVANALPSLKETAHYVATASRGAGVAELITLLIKTDLSEWQRPDAVPDAANAQLRPR